MAPGRAGRDAAASAHRRASSAKAPDGVAWLDGGGLGWLLPDDVDPPGGAAGSGALEPWAALLPVLDPTVMGWKRRGFYLGDLGPQLFDRNGSAGTTAWVDGRVVGGWTRGPSGDVRLRLLAPVPDRARRELEEKAERLGVLLAGRRARASSGPP